MAVISICALIICLKMGGGSKQFQIHCFEPSIHTFKLLESHYTTKLQHIAPNTANVVLNNFGLGESSQEMTLYYDEIGSGLASLTQRRLKHFDISLNNSEQVQIKTIDSYCKEHNIRHINLLKIDVEGHELSVLNGAKAMFERKNIDLVTFEFGGCNIDTRTFFQDFWYFFNDNGMSIYRILPNAKLYKIERYKELYEQFLTTNYLAMNMV